MTMPLEKATVVVVEDDDNSHLAAKELLNFHGVTKIHQFKDNNSTMAFVEATSDSIDLFLVDIHLPGETGYDLLKWIRANKKVAKVRVVALTAGVLFEDIRQARMAGFDAFIGKPLKPQEFGHQLERILAGESLWEWR